MSRTKENTLSRLPQVYANKLKRFLMYKEYDKDTCLLLGVIAQSSVKKHTALNDEIKTAITSLELGDTTGHLLITCARITLGYK